MKRAIQHHFLAFALWAVLAGQTTGSWAQEASAFVRLSADKQNFQLVSVRGDTIAGRHDELGLLSKYREALSVIFVPTGLNVADTTISAPDVLITLESAGLDEAVIGFTRLDPAARRSDLVWAVDSNHVQPPGEFWPGDMLVFDGRVTISGEVGGSIIAIGSDVIIREGATVRGGVVVIGGILRQRGDGKIYGAVFAPGGHRRPRLSVTRAWEFDDEGVRWGPSFSYDRVDGARLGGRISYQKSAYSPRLSVFGGYALASETWQYRFEIQQRLLRNIDLELRGAVFRLTETDDEDQVGRHANTLFALVAGSDYRDYFGADGGELALKYKFRERGIVSATFRNVDYRWMTAERNLWHLFRPNHLFRRNFSTVPTILLEPLMDRFERRTSAVILSAGVEPRESHEHPSRFDANIHTTLEVAGGALGGDFDYDRWQLHAVGLWNGDFAHRVTARFWYGSGRRDLPPNKLFYLGGIGTLPGYSQKEFVGSEVMLASVEYRFNYWPNEIFDGGIILFFDAGRATFEEDFFELSKFKSDVGIGLGIGEEIRLDIAKGLDNTTRDIRLSLRLEQAW